MTAADLPLSANAVPVTRKTKWTPHGVVMLAAYGAGLVYLALLGLLYTPYYGSIILIPRQAEPQMYETADKNVGQKHEDYVFTNANHDRLHGWLWRNPASKKIIIFHHGNAGNISYRTAATQALLIGGANVFDYDYRGYGKSSGKPSLQGLLDDGLAAFDFVHDQLHFDSKDIISYGESIGAGPACEVASKRSSGGLILQSGISSLPRIGKLHFAFLLPYPDFLFPAPHMDNVALVHDIRCPITIINGGKDTTVPFSEAQTIYKNAREPKHLVLLKDSGHNAVLSLDDLHAYMTAIKQALSESTTYSAAVTPTGMIRPVAYSD